MNDQAIQAARMGGNDAAALAAPRYPDNHEGCFVKGVLSALLLLALAVVIVIAAWKVIDVATGGEDRPEACKAYRGAEVSACVVEAEQ